MSTNDNPYAGPSGGYTTQTNFGTEGGGAAAPAADVIRDTTTAGFAADVIQESRRQPVLVDFWAPWCGPCKQLTPVLEKVVRESRGAVKLVKMNIDDHPSIAGQLGIQSIPAVIAFRDGRPVDGFMGAVPESQIRAFIGKLGGPAADPVADALAEAKALLEAGDREGASAVYADVLQAVPDSVPAIVGLAGLLLDADDVEQAQELLGMIPADAKETPELAGVRAKLALAQQVSELGDPRELQRRLEADPKDHDARFDLAMIENARGDRHAAANHLLDIVRSDRAWREDGARMQLLKLFEAWGMTDEATLSARRRLSSLLFS